MNSESSIPTPPPLSFWGRVKFFFRVLQVWLRFIVMFVLAGLAVAYWERIDRWYDDLTRPAPTKAENPAGQFEYRCPMHPQVVRDEPGNCYICGMPLVKRPKGKTLELSPGTLARIQLTPQKMSLGGVQTSAVTPQLLIRELYEYGDLEPDQPLVVDITAKIRGRIEELLVNYDGAPVQAGQVLFRQFSENLFRAQQEYLITQNEEEDRQRTQGLIHPPIGGTLVDAAKRRLQDYGFTEAQIQDLNRTKTPQLITPIRSPINGFVLMRNALQGQYYNEGVSFYRIADLSKVWLQIRVFEDQLDTVKLGTAVEVHTTAFPARVFLGKIIFIAPTVDPATRTVAARVEVDNPDNRLRPGMYAEAVIKMPAGKLEVLTPGKEENAETPKPPTADTQPSALPPPPADLVPQSLVDAYLHLAEALAADKNDPAAIQALASAGIALREKEFGELRRAVAALPQAKGLEAVRDALVPLGDKLRAALTKTGQVSKYYVAYCPMKPGYWLQTGETIANPFYGSEMLRCGEIKQKPGEENAETPKHQNAKTQNSELKTQNSAATPITGYYCPLTPDRLYAQPGECPIERAPMVYARLEPVLAVPESAVIDTGSKTFVYRAADAAVWGEGVFDLVEVKLAPQAKGPQGMYYPVLSGLKAGEHVVTRGTFAVDAENRLSGSYPQ